MKNMYDLLEKLHMPAKPLSMTAQEHYRKGIRGFQQAMVLSSRSAQNKYGTGFEVPYVIDQEGNA